jgi:hypothetical protein
METTESAGEPGTVQRGRFTRTLIVLELALSVGAIGGALNLVVFAARDAMPADLLARTPFSSWVWPGIALMLTVAVPAAIVAIGAWVGRPFAHVGHPLVGMILIGWIIVQVWVIGPVSALQPVMAIWGLLITVLGASNYRSWHLSWGATTAEGASAMAGDGLVTHPHFAPTRAITIDAPPAEVWPWIVQMGYGRAGWYSYDHLDNRGRPSAEVIRPELQDVAIGEVISMSGRDDDRTAFRVVMITPDRHIVWAKPDATWAWQLTPTGDGGTRLVTRVRARYQGWTALFGVPLMELGDFPMMRRCLLGIKRRVQRREIVAASAGAVR